ncbi:MAG: hypothetical protein EOP83_08605 [Verrucomicrobiaceae bacterium]|nr:MAG: hypothetical protein EOP83_08605 [Verrucomicrobiaceae bacterium]
MATAPIRTLHELFTTVFSPDDLIRVVQLWRARGTESDFHRTLQSAFIDPRMTKFNELSQQENDPSYLAYGLEYYINRMG